MTSPAVTLSIQHGVVIYRYTVDACKACVILSVYVYLDI